MTVLSFFKHIEKRLGKEKREFISGKADDISIYKSHRFVFNAFPIELGTVGGCVIFE
jgi:hypothetical protein